MVPRTGVFFPQQSIILASAAAALSSVGSPESFLPLAFGFSLLGLRKRNCAVGRPNSVFPANNYLNRKLLRRGDWYRPMSSSQSKRFITERSGDGTITVSPQNEGDQSALVVICHGLGDTAEGFVDVAEV
jgi:hypothetical protein